MFALFLLGKSVWDLVELLESLTANDNWKGPGIEPSILRHSGTSWVAHKAVLKKVTWKCSTAHPYWHCKVLQKQTFSSSSKGAPPSFLRCSETNLHNNKADKKVDEATGVHRTEQAKEKKKKYRKKCFFFQQTQYIYFQGEHALAYKHYL